jgi:hypothetical protein
MDHRLTCAQKADFIQFVAAQFTGYGQDHCSPELPAVLLLGSSELSHRTT